MLTRKKSLSLLALVLGITLASRAQAVDPLRWPEPQRSFFQDGPGLLLSADRRAELLRLDEPGRGQLIESFLKDPIPSTPANELREGIERRRRLAFAELQTFADVRAQLLFLNGPPAERYAVDCGTAFKPLEIWTYRLGTGSEAAEGTERQIVAFQAGPGEPFRAWEPGDSKRALYTPWMENWLEQWEQLGGRVKRFDLQVCKDARRVDRATAIPGLTGVRPTRRDRRDAVSRSRIYGLRPGSDESLLDPPADLAAWARQAAATQVPPPPPALAGVTLELDYPQLQGQRMLTRGLVTVPAAALGSVAGEDAKVRKLLIEGIVEEEGKPFDDFRLRYRLTAPEGGAPVALSFQEPLRSGQPFLLRLRVKDEGSGAEARLVQGFTVPLRPAPSPSWNTAAVAGESVDGESKPPSADALVLLPPEGDVVLGLWRAEAVVTGERIKKVTFLVDGKALLSRGRAPYTTEIRIGNAPAELRVRAEGYDQAGALVASDEVVLNRPREAFEIRIVEPAEGVSVSGKTLIKADVVVPEGKRVEKVEVSVNDRPAATLERAPWQAEVDIPEEEVVYVTVAATLDGGDRLEEVRFVRAPDYLEQLDVRLVEMYAAVTDRSGRLVKGLTADDFEVSESGQPQAITKFELVENLPLTVGITLDTSGSMETSLVEARRAASEFLKGVVAPRDRAFAVHFNNRPDLLVPPTDDVEAVIGSLEGLQAVGGTALHDAVIASLHYFRATRGQRVLVLLSDGDDTASTAKFDDALEYARRSGVSIYVIGLNIPFSQVLARKKLNDLAEATGGRTFFASKAEELASYYEQIEQEVRSRYLIAFQASSGGTGYRPVEVRSKRDGLRVRTARGYYP